MFKLVASIAGIDHKKLRTERLTLEDEDRLQSATGQLLESGDLLLIDQASSLTVSDIRMRTRNIERMIGKVDLIVVDYLQLMSSADLNRKSYDNRALEVAQMTRGLKHVAMDLELPLIVMSQLNRKPTERKDNRPQLADLRDSGAIEQDADVILFLHREPESDGDQGVPRGDQDVDDDKDSVVTEIIIGKQRNGPIGEFKLNFRRNLTKFENHVDSEVYDTRMPPPGPVGDDYGPDADPR